MEGHRFPDRTLRFGEESDVVYISSWRAEQLPRLTGRVDHAVS